MVKVSGHKDLGPCALWDPLPWPFCVVPIPWKVVLYHPGPWGTGVKPAAEHTVVLVRANLYDGLGSSWRTFAEVVPVEATGFYNWVKAYPRIMQKCCAGCYGYKHKKLPKTL